MKTILRSLDFLRDLAALPLMAVARWRRARGLYDTKTATLFQWAGRVGGRHSTMAWLLFRRDLGHKLPRVWLLENNCEFSLNPRVAKLWAALAVECGVPLSGGDPLAQTIWTEQAAWQKEFAMVVQKALAHEIWVVGNGPSVRDCDLGQRIDAAGLVVRFNHWGSQASDVGTRCDLWVRAPDLPIDTSEFDPESNKSRPAWVALSGPDMQFRLEKWESWKDWIQSGSPLLSVPLSVWQELVAQLQAPPSAGLLTLLWLRHLAGTWHGIKATGFGHREGIYHAHLPNHQPSRRHRWKQEIDVLSQWQEEGLQIFPSGV